MERRGAAPDALRRILLGCRNSRAEDSLVERGEELARSNAALSEFAYLASHDLQEPLRGVNGCVQLLAKRYGDQLDEEGREWIRHAVLNTERMQSLISGLLDLSRIERHPAIRSTAVDCDAVLLGTLNALQQTIRERDAQINVSWPLPLVQGDARQIGQIFQNLIANSIKFHAAEPPRIAISAEEMDSGFVEFIVRDNGIGIDPKHAERIFGIFQRLHAQGKFPGAGIGLSVAKRIVERHGGRIWVVSETGQRGAEFRFTLPLCAKVNLSDGKAAKGAAAR
jgi:light-regulated signal transduction histidine kinase (bacteriophytochrome)